MILRGHDIVFFPRRGSEAWRGQTPLAGAQTPLDGAEEPVRAPGLPSALIREAVTARQLCGFQLHAGQEPPQRLAAVVIQRGGVDGLGVLGVDDGGAEEAAGLVAGLEAHFGLVAAPGAVGDAGDRLAAGGHGQAQGQVDVVDEVPLGVVPDRRRVPGRREKAARSRSPEPGAQRSPAGP